MDPRCCYGQIAAETFFARSIPGFGFVYCQPDLPPLRRQSAHPLGRHAPVYSRAQTDRIRLVPISWNYGQHCAVPTRLRNTLCSEKIPTLPNHLNTNPSYFCWSLSAFLCYCWRFLSAFGTYPSAAVNNPTIWGLLVNLPDNSSLLLSAIKVNGLSFFKSIQQRL